MSGGVDHREIEAHALALLAQGDRHAAVVALVEGLGPTIYRFQLKMLNGREDLAGDAWSMFLEDLWTGIEKFGGRSRLRTWLFSVACNAVRRLRRDPRLAGRHVSWPSQDLEAASRAIFTTAVGLDTAWERFQRYFAELEEEEQWLLVFRVALTLEWEEIVRILSGELEAQAARRESARLRQSYRRVVQRLKARAAADGVHL